MVRKERVDYHIDFSTSEYEGTKLKSSYEI